MCAVMIRSGGQVVNLGRLGSKGDNGGAYCVSHRTECRVKLTGRRCVYQDMPRGRMYETVLSGQGAALL